jgi:2-methylcitrate dehydratase PrpD
LGTTAAIAEFLYSTGYDDIPAEVVGKAKQHILDCVGVTLAGSTAPIGRIVHEYLVEQGSSKHATVIGLGLRTTPPLAAWANGTLGHALDYDDNSIDNPIAIHPTVVTLPTVLSLGETRRTDGRDAIAALVLGIEVASTLGRSMTPRDFRVWHGTGTLGTVASAAAAAKLLSLTPQEIRCALGIASSTAAGLVANFGTMTKPFHAGHAGRNGVVAAMLAQKGFTSAPDVLEVHGGYGYALAKTYDFDGIRDRLGDPWEIANPGIHIKRYPSCMATHHAIDAILALREDHRIDPRDVDGVEVGTQRNVTHTLIHTTPTTALEAKFSMQFCMAMALLEGSVTLAEFRDEVVRDPQVQELGSKVTLKTDPEIDAKGRMAARVTITTTSGRRLTRLVEHAKGSRLNPLTRDEVYAKYATCAAYALAPERVEALADVIWRLEEIDDLTTVMALIPPA